MKLVFKLSLYGASVIAEIGITSNGSLFKEIEDLQLAITETDDSLYEDGEKTYEVIYGPLVGSASVPAILRFVNRLAVRGWKVNKQNFVNLHYGYKRPYVLDEKPGSLKTVRKTIFVYRRLVSAPAY